jgi:hypothetical protein
VFTVDGIKPSVRSLPVQAPPTRGRRARLRYEAKVRRGEINQDVITYEGDASALAVPYIDTLDDMTLLHVVRNPLHEVDALYTQGIFADLSNPVAMYVAKHLEGFVEKQTPLERVIDFVTRWDRDLGAPVFTIDNPDSERIKAVYGYLTDTEVSLDKCEQVIANVGQYDPKVVGSITWESLDGHYMTDTLIAKATHYGYDVPKVGEESELDSSLHSDDSTSEEASSESTTVGTTTDEAT